MIKNKILLFLALVLICQSAQATNPLEDFLKSINFDSSSSLNESFRNILSQILALGQNLKPLFMENTSSEEKPYYKFVPVYKATVIPNSGSVSWQGSCFQENTATAATNADGSVTVTLKLSKSKSLLCSEFYFLATISDFKIPEFFFSGTHTVHFTLSARESEQFDLHNKGVRIFQFLGSPLQILKYVVSTAELFAPALMQHVPDYFANLNRDFLRHYTGIDMQPRNITKVEIDESLIHSGDHFAIIRLDGLDPMITYGMGSATGHTTVAMWRNGSLYVCESQAKGGYWPINAVQCNLYKDWLRMAENADYNLVWVPLSDENRAKFNETAANEFIDQMLGIDYGYEVMLMGWIDSVSQNLPCLPPAFEQCITPELLDVLFANIVKYVPVAGRVWVQAMRQRVGGKGETLADIYYEAHKQGIDSRVLPTLVEKDGWIYNTTRYGNPTQSPVMICNVFACNIWRSAGLFGNKTLNCGEFSVWDSYKINIFQKDFKRPQQCVDADPENPLCQLLGKFSLRLDSGPGKIEKYNYVEVVDHMGENCPSLVPDYVADRGC